LEILFDREGLFVALNTVAETLDYQLLMLDADYFLACFAAVLFRFVLNSIMIDYSL